MSKVSVAQFKHALREATEQKYSSLKPKDLEKALDFLKADGRIDERERKAARAFLNADEFTYLNYYETRALARKELADPAKADAREEKRAIRDDFRKQFGDLGSSPFSKEHRIDPKSLPAPVAAELGALQKLLANQDGFVEKNPAFKLQLAGKEVYAIAWNWISEPRATLYSPEGKQLGEMDLDG